MTARLGAFSWQWATVRKIKSYVSYRARTVLEPAGEWVPRPSGPTQAPGIPPIAALASHGARLQVTSSSNLRDVGPIKLAH